MGLLQRWRKARLSQAAVWLRFAATLQKERKPSGGPGARSGEPMIPPIRRVHPVKAAKEAKVKAKLEGKASVAGKASVKNATVAAAAAGKVKVKAKIAKR